jgi:hypothetical protein
MDAARYKRTPKGPSRRASIGVGLGAALEGREDEEAVAPGIVEAQSEGAGGVISTRHNTH